MSPITKALRASVSLRKQLSRKFPEWFGSVAVRSCDPPRLVLYLSDEPGDDRSLHTLNGLSGNGHRGFRVDIVAPPD